MGIPNLQSYITVTGTNIRTQDNSYTFILGGDIEVGSGMDFEVGSNSIFEVSP